jgi:hypothetical protein
MLDWETVTYFGSKSEKPKDKCYKGADCEKDFNGDEKTQCKKIQSINQSKEVNKCPGYIAECDENNKAEHDEEQCEKKRAEEVEKQKKGDRCQSLFDWSMFLFWVAFIIFIMAILGVIILYLFIGLYWIIHLINNWLFYMDGVGEVQDCIKYPKNSRYYWWNDEPSWNINSEQKGGRKKRQRGGAPAADAPAAAASPADAPQADASPADAPQADASPADAEAAPVTNSKNKVTVEKCIKTIISNIEFIRRLPKGLRYNDEKEKAEIDQIYKSPAGEILRYGGFMGLSWPGRLIRKPDWFGPPWPLTIYNKVYNHQRLEPWTMEGHPNYVGKGYTPNPNKFIFRYIPIGAFLHYCCGKNGIYLALSVALIAVILWLIVMFGECWWIMNFFNTGDPKDEDLEKMCGNMSFEQDEKIKKKCEAYKCKKKNDTCSNMEKRYRKDEEAQPKKQYTSTGSKIAKSIFEDELDRSSTLPQLLSIISTI